MKHLAEYRDADTARRLAAEIGRIATRPWAIMEVCGGQTHSIIRNGVDQLLPPEVELIHGPGCPVCVTPLETIDRGLAVAAKPGVIFCSFGDMLRVPGSRENLFTVKGRGADVRVVYSPLDAVKLARENPGREVVFLAIGFETTAPANAMAVKLAKQQGLANFSMLVSHVLVPPAIEAIMRSPGNRVNAFLAAGHVCSVMGTWQYPPRNAYARVVSGRGNEPAQTVIAEVFEPVDRAWRGIGVIPGSGWRLADAYRDFDAEVRFAVGDVTAEESPLCRSGEVLRGTLKPNQCPAFGKECTPRTPLGATMVSSEGACAAYFHFGRFAGP